MLKILLLFIISLTVCLSAGARPILKSHDQFTGLSDSQKNDLIIKTMKAMVALEDQYLKDVQKYGHNQKRFESFQRAVSQLTDLLLKDAYADDPSAEWDRLAASYVSLRNSSTSQRHQKQCVFGGWISHAYVSSRGITCRHPSYRDSIGNQMYSNSCGAGKISCNPLIFGYKKAENKSLFCADSNVPAHNSSLECMQQALSPQEDTSSVDSAATRLSFLRQRYAADPTLYNSIQGFLYQTCLCADNPVNFSSAYRDAINFHRTCFGLMRTVAETCDDPGVPQPLRESNVLEQIRGLTIEAALSSRFNQDAERGWDAFRASVPNDTHHQTICNGTVSTDPEPEPEPEPGPTYSCTGLQCSGEGDARACTYDLLLDGVALASTDTTNISQTAETAENVSISFTHNGAEHPVTCPKATPAEEVLTCSIACQKPVTSEDPSAEPIPGVCTPAVTVNGEAVEFVPNPALDPGTIEATSDGELRTVRGTVGDAEKSFECSVTIQDPATTTTAPEESNSSEDGGGPSITITEVSRSETHIVIKASITDVTEGWEFKWSSAEGEETPSGHTDTETEKYTKRKRQTEDYIIKGVLKKEGSPDKEGSATISKGQTVPPATPPTPSGGFQPPQPPPIPIRGTSDTSAGGIR